MPTEREATDQSPLDELHVNRSGSGGSGGAATGEEDEEGSAPASMEELLGGDPGEDDQG